MKRPFVLWILIFFLVFLALGGLYGGIAMLTDPSGNLLQMAEILPMLPVPDYTLPGLFLLFVMGIAPLFLTFGLLARPNWAWATSLSRWSNHHWSWAGTVVLGIILVLWLIIEAIMIGFEWPIQYVTAVNGILILLLALVPSVRKYYAQ